MSPEQEGDDLARFKLPDTEELSEAFMQVTTGSLTWRMIFRHHLLGIAGHEFSGPELVDALAVGATEYLVDRMGLSDTPLRLAGDSVLRDMHRVIEGVIPDDQARYEAKRYLDENFSRTRHPSNGAQ